MDLASDCFESMELSGITPDLIAWNSLISGFSQLGDLERARQLLGEMRGRGLKPGVNSWNGIISGCVKNGFINEALHLFCEMQAFEIPNSVTISSILGACSDPKALKLGKEIHGYANKHGFYVDLFVEGSLINMYLKCKACDYAQRVFATIEKKNSAIWNEMISGYVNQGKMEEALEIMHQMVRDGVKPDAIACNTLLAGYAKMGQKEEAFKLFRDMGSMGLKPDFVSINLLIAGFQQAGLAGDALKLFHELLKPGGASGNVAEAFDFFYMEAWPNEITISSVLSACADLKLKLQGKEIHGYLLRKGFQNNVFVSSALGITRMGSPMNV
ncbi:hypothetical protein AMTR_s00049p00087580 [Amborella trichopoda]|uniref:Pentacotripeptide-repeat region of PRORP domain-containing protein n=1 Tax=Amborella trichopoda TaxID=13333 RepID=W1PUC1_AMBTC|nr:hypothetical protein AMTR_s00049p00087580 [Amborella trichopoda]